MSRFRIVNIFDKVFVSCCVFLITYAWFNFFIRNLWFSFFASLVLSSAILFLSFYLLEKKNTKKCLSKKRIEDIEKTFLGFKLMPLIEKLNLIKSIISENSNAELFEDSILIKSGQELHQIFVTTTEKFLSEQSFFNILEKRQKNIKKLYIICENFNTNLNINLVSNLDIQIVDKTIFFDEYISNSSVLIDTSILNYKTKKTIKQMCKNFFIPIKSKQYFFCGLILIFSSLILPYKTYYLICGTLLLTFAILCKLQPVISNRINRKN